MKNSLIMMAASLTSVVAMAANTPVFYPAAPEQPRIQFLKSMNGGSFFVGGNGFGSRFPGYDGPAGKESDPIVKPYGIASTQGKIYVCDTGTATIKIFDLDKKYITSFGGQRPGKLSFPLNIAIDANGMKYVTDSGLNKIMVYDASNNFVKSFGNPEKMKPTDIVIAKGNLYVTDVKNSQVVIMNPTTGVEISRFSQAGVEAADLLKATNLTTDTTGNIVVADTMGGKISVFNDAGKFVKNVGSIGDQIGQFARPKGLAVDRENRLYAVDSAFENIQIFNSDGRLLLPFGEAGNAKGGMNMPVKVAIDYNNAKYFKQYVAPGFDVDYLIFVTNQFGDNRVNVYGFLKKL